MATSEPRRAYQTLDGLRAAGALVIVMRHVPAFFGPLRAPESFLAVDLFYLISGFVIAHAYGERLKGGASVVDFMKTRIIRLYPLYLIGIALGVVMAAVSMMTDPHPVWTPIKIAIAVGTGLLMIPRFPWLTINGTTLDGPIWTLFWELVANLIYALIVRILNLWMLLAIIVVGGAGVVAAELHYGTLDVGYSLTDQWAALSRVGFSFFAGVLVYRMFGHAKQVSNWAAWAATLALAAVMAVHIPKGFTAAYEIGAILVGMPLLVIAAGRFEPGPRSGRLFSFVGLASYGVYIIHQPLGNLLVKGVSSVMRIPRDLSGALFGLAFIALLILLSWWLDGHYDAPFRAFLRARFLDRKPRPAKAAA